MTVCKFITDELSTFSTQRPTARQAADILYFDLFATAPNPALGDAVLLGNLRSWLVSHFAEAIIRKKQSPVLYKVCENFFSKMNPLQMMKNMDLWLAIAH